MAIARGISVPMGHSCRRQRVRSRAVRCMAGLIWGAIFLLAVSCSSAGRGARPAEGGAVLLVPEVNAGVAGWCLSTPPEGGCARGRSRPPVVAETWSGGSTGATGYALTTSAVRSVSIDGGAVIATHEQSGLPDGLRGVSVEIAGLDPERERLPRFTPLNAAGDVIPQAAGRGNEISRGTLAVEVPVRSVSDPARPQSGACRIIAEGLGQVTVQGGSVVTVVKTYSGLIGEGYISCASTSYTVDGWPLLASVLLDAAHPGTSPRPLPDMRPLKGHVGMFYAPGPEGSSFEGGLVARRIPGAWLVVSRAKLQQRVSLLEHLHALVSL
jgi:hypothetical protein